MEAAGIEPASENVPQKSLHTCQVPILSHAPTWRNLQASRGTSPLSFAFGCRASGLRLSCMKWRPLTNLQAN